jgi:hypothetical protein
MNKSISSSELKSLTGAKKLNQAISIIASRLEKRNWMIGEYRVQFSGINWIKDTVLFFWCQNAGENLASYRYWTISIEDAIDCINGKIALEITERRA